MKTRINFALVVALLISTFSFLVGPGASASDLSDRGQAAIEQIATCINSDGKNQLNVFYLIDESASLTWNDPNSLRVQGLIQSLEQFRDVTTTKPYFTINRAISTFGKEFTLRKGWEKLDNAKLDSDIKWITEEVPNLNRGQSTDWEIGLKGALSEFKKVKTKSTCNVLVWFTDGGVQVGTTLETSRSSLARVCGNDPLTGRATGSVGLIDEFRRGGINIQGVLLRNQEFIDDPVGFRNGDITKRDADNEIARMSYFLPVVEQSGGVSAGAFSNGGIGKFDCGTYVGAGGVLHTVADPVDIIWPPVQFSCLSENGRILPINLTNGQVKVDAALTRFTLTSPANSFSVKNGDGAEIANSKGAVKGDVKHSLIGSSGAAVQIKGKIGSSSSVTKPGIWTISAKDLDRAVFCGYLEVEITLSVGTCYSGETCDFSGTITRFGKPIDFKNYQSVKAQASQVDAVGKGAAPVNLNLDPGTSEFKSSFVPAGNTQVANLKIGLNVITATGIEFNIGTIKPISVIPPGLYPEVTPAPITPTDFSQGLIGKRGEALATLTLKGPSRTNGQVCMGPLEVRSDVNPNRIKDYVSKVDGTDLGDNPCFTLIAGSKQEVQLSIKNGESADGTVSGYITTTLKSDGKEDIQTKVDVKFQTSRLTDTCKKWLYVALFMFLGLALPLLLLSVFNSRNSRLILDNIYRASIPITFSASGNFVNIARVEKLSNSDVLGQEDFSPFSAGKEIVRSKQVGSETLRGITPKNPFGNLQALLTTSPGMTIASSGIKQGRKLLPSNQAPGALNPSGLAFVTLPDHALEQLKLENQGSRESNEPIEGTLTALLSLNTGDPVAQVDYLNTRIMHEGGWLNGLLSIVINPLKVENSEAAKRAFGGRKNKKNQSANSIPATQVDEWGAPSSGGAGSSTSSGSGSAVGNQSIKTDGDDWGKPSTSSDWDSPGSSSNSNEEW